MRTLEVSKVKNNFYPYVICLVVVIYITTQFLTIASTSNTGFMLKEVAYKQKTVFQFLINQSIESALRTSTIEDVLKIGTSHKEPLLKTIGFNNSIKVYDVNFFDLDGNLLNENYEGINSFSSVFGNINPSSIIEPTVVNIRYSKTYNDTVMDILIPVYENMKLTSIMWQTESFERINSAMKNVSILHTGESYIINDKGIVLTDLKKISSIDNSITIKEEKLIDSTVDGFESKPYLDYNDEYVYGYHTNLNFNRWKLIVEIDEDEITNTSSEINSFLVKSITLILAISKILEPIISKRKTEKKDLNCQCKGNSIIQDYKTNKNIIENNNSKILLKNVKKIISNIIILYKLMKSYLSCAKTFYKNRKNSITIVILIICTLISIVSIYKVKIDNEIQNKLDTSSQVNRRLISYFVNEVKGQFYLTNRIITEYKEVDIYNSLKRSQNINSNMLNIAVLDENNNEIYNTRNLKYNLEYAMQAIEENNSTYNSIGISDIFYDVHYGEYVYYMSSKVLDHKNDKWINSICVVSAEKLISMLNNNETHTSRMITILKDREIMYSNSYAESEISQENYLYLRKNMNTNYEFNGSIFNVNKYENIQGVEVYGNYSDIDNSKVVVYGSYGAINDTKWQLLYEEPTDIAQKRALKGTINLLVNVLYQYIENIVEMIG